MLRTLACVLSPVEGRAARTNAWFNDPHHGVELDVWFNGRRNGT